MIRDLELNRLIKYAQGMGISVNFKPYVKGSKDEALWTIDGTKIEIFVKATTTKLDKILSLIHEIAHHKTFVNNGRKIDPAVEEALDAEDDKKKFRKALYEDETEATKYWEEIYRDTNCQFDKNKLYMQKEFDIWTYRVYYETGEYPTRKMQAEKRKELKKVRWTTE